MRALHSATCDRDLEGDTPEWVHLLPAGRITARDGRRFDLANPQAVIAAFDAGGIDLPIDYEHQNDRETSNGPVPAAGWIKELHSRADGLWGRVEWTATARELIASKAYRFLSPSFIHHADDKTIVRLRGAGLVHSPALHLTALASQEDPMADDMTLTQKLAAMLKLAEDATDDDIIAALQEMMGKADTPDPSKFVPIEAMQDALRERNTQSATMSEQQAKSKVTDAIAKGYISPGMRDWATALCKKDEASFDSFLSKAVPHFAHLSQQVMPAGVPDHSTGEIDQSDAAASICRQLGLKAGTLNT